MSKPLLHRLPSTGRYDKKYRVHGHDHLIVEAYYSDAEDRKPEFGYWGVYDTRFTALDRHGRNVVLCVDYLSDVRSWLTAGGAKLWDPEKKIADRKWRPIPEGWAPGDGRTEGRGRVPFEPFGEKGSIAVEGSRTLESVPRRPAAPRDLRGKKYAVVPGWVTSTNDRRRHWIGFGALTWLYGVDPAECIEIDRVTEHGWNDEGKSHLIWLYPEESHEDYELTRRELARGDDAFKLIDP